MVWVRIENQEFVIGHMRAPTFATCSLAAPDPEEQTEFVRIFTTCWRKTYVDKIESYNNDKFIYTNEKMDGRHAEVCSKMRSSSDRAIAEYAADTWKVESCPVPERNNRWSKKK
jgi:hypothetical protein